MSQKTQGVQALLEAERKAAEIVQGARDYRTKVLREARDDAKKLIEQKRQEAEASYKKYASENDTGSKSAEESANQEVTKRVSVMEEALSKSKDTVSKELLQAVLTVGWIKAHDYI